MTPTHPRSDRPPVIVTGSTGLIGTALIARLKETFQIVGFDRDLEPYAQPEVETVCVDLADDRSVELAVARVAHAYGTQLAAVVHLAAYYDFRGEPSDLYEQVNVRGTTRLLDALRAAGASTGVFVYSSSMLVHRPGEPGQPIDEHAPLEGKWDYPASKIRAEQAIAERLGAGRGERAVLLRIAGIYSERGDSIPISQQIHRIEQRQLEAHLYPGDLSHGQSFVHLDDAVDAIVRTVERRETLPPGVTPVLIGEPETFSYGELQQRLGELLHGDPEWSTRHIPKGLAKAGAWIKDKLPAEQFVKPWMIDLADDHYELDIGRARDLLGWQPQHRLVDTLPAMVAELQRDPEDWRRRHHLAD